MRSSLSLQHRSTPQGPDTPSNTKNEPQASESILQRLQCTRIPTNSEMQFAGSCKTSLGDLSAQLSTSTTTLNSLPSACERVGHNHHQGGATIVNQQMTANSSEGCRNCQGITIADRASITNQTSQLLCLTCMHEREGRAESAQRSDTLHQAHARPTRASCKVADTRRSNMDFETLHVHIDEQIASRVSQPCQPPRSWTMAPEAARLRRRSMSCGGACNRVADGCMLAQICQRNITWCSKMFELK